MTTYGVTATGFVTKRLADIKGEMEDSYRTTFGQGVDLSAESPLGQFIGIQAEREAKVWELAEGVYNAAYPDTAEGVPLDNVIALTGIRRKGKTFSKATGVLFYGTAGTLIPKASVANVAGNATARFVTDADMTIAAAVIEVQHIAFNHVPTGGGPWKITWNGLQTGNLAYNANAAAVQIALRLLTGLGSVTVTGDYTAGFDVTFAGTVGDQPQLTITGSTLTYASGNVTVTPSTTTAGLPAQVTGSMTAETSGAVAAPAHSLTVIATPVSGWASLTNPTDAAVGNEIEEDPALKLRRAQSVGSNAGSTAPAVRSKLLSVSGVVAVLMFENLNGTTDGSGRPGHSFEAVIEGGADADVAAAIFSEKPGGIQTYGTTTVAVVDSQGNSHNISFSRPTSVNIYVEVDITVNSLYPTDGDAAVSLQMLAYGASLGLGDDVIPAPAMMGFLAKVAGITTAVIKVGTAPSPSSSANIVIDTFQLAVFDSGRIAVVRS